MAKLILNGDDEAEVAAGEGLKDTCEEAGVPFCCEEGVCGTCVIEVEEGMEHLSPFTEEESDFLGEMENERLACQCQIKENAKSDAEVKIKY